MRLSEPLSVHKTNEFHTGMFFTIINSLQYLRSDFQAERVTWLTFKVHHEFYLIGILLM